ncbi:MAG: class I SAM-dependent methyltransferase [Pigmentiphaga sp.]|nr:class I SAM-dependent methyltransferase [Pigmentiphaga sp.]
MMSGNADLALLRLGEMLQKLDYRHVTVTPITHARVNARPGNAWAVDLNGVFGWSRPFHAEAVPAPIFELMRQAGIAVAYHNGWRSLLRASTLNGHLYFHSAWPTEASDAVFFGPDTYRYVAAISRHLAQHGTPIRRAVDIGCGAGPGAIALATQLPDTETFAVDINDSALRLSRINAALAGAPIQVLKSDLLADIGGNFDWIVANPPYMLDREKRAYRHGGGALGAGLSLAIVEAALRRLNPGGTLLLYTGSVIVDGQDGFLKAATAMLPNTCSWSYQEIDPDVFGEELKSGAYAHADRIAAVVLCARLSASWRIHHREDTSHLPR